MSKQPIISVSGLRGIIGESLDPLLAMRFVIAFVQSLPAGPILVARDGRTTGRMLADGICSAINSLGRDALDADIAATPTVGVLVRDRECAGGIQISASHNPPEYNGIKLFGPDGRVISAAQGQQVIERFLEPNEIPFVDHEKVGRRIACQNQTDEHLQSVLATVDVQRIRAKRFRVLLDANRGSGSILGRRLLESLGCQYTILGDSPDGQFEHPAEPTAANLQEVAKRIKQTQVDVGFCQDPDADRLAIIDEQGNYIGEEFTLAITLQHALQQHPGPVVINCATSRMSIDLAKQAGCQCHQSAVGEANVCDAMLRWKAVYGGEGNGGPIDPRVGFVRDSFVAMAQTLDALAANEQTVSELVAAIPHYGMHKDKLTLPAERLPAALNAIASHFSDATPSRLDGLRLDWPDRWLLVRGSNTEPIVRTIAEAPTLAEAQQLCEEAQRIIAAL
jgi:phosphomannomutase